MWACRGHVLLLISMYLCFVFRCLAVVVYHCLCIFGSRYRSCRWIWSVGGFGVAVGKNVSSAVMLSLKMFGVVTVIDILGYFD